MKKLYSFDKFINEGVKDLMTGKSEDDIRKSLRDMYPEDQLLKGCLYGYVWLVEEAFEEGVDIDYQNSYGVGALQIASYNGHIDIVKLLLNKGIDLNKKEIVKEFRPKPFLTIGQSALREASVRGHEEIIQLLLDNGVYPNVDNWDWHSRKEITPYIYRLLNKYKKTNEGVKDLMTPKSMEEIDRNLKNVPYRDLMNHLMDGVADNDEARVEMMFKYIKKDFGYCLEMAETAINYGNIRIIKMFLDKGMPDDVLWHLFDYAHERKKYEISDLIKNYIYMNEGIRDKMTPKSDEEIDRNLKNAPYRDIMNHLMDGVIDGDEEKVEMMFKYINKDFEYCQYMAETAINYGNIRIIKMFLDKGMPKDVLLLLRDHAHKRKMYDISNLIKKYISDTKKEEKPQGIVNRFKSFVKK